MVDGEGVVAAHTGSRCVAASGHAGGDGVSAQANMMERDTVWDAMVGTYGSAEGSLAERLLAALLAAEREGGDIRGRQSAGSSSSAALDKIHRGSGPSTFASMTIPIP